MDFQQFSFSQTSHIIIIINHPVLLDQHQHQIFQPLYCVIIIPSSFIVICLVPFSSVVCMYAVINLFYFISILYKYYPWSHHPSLPISFCSSTVFSFSSIRVWPNHEKNIFYYSTISSLFWFLPKLHDMKHLRQNHSLL